MAKSIVAFDTSPFIYFLNNHPGLAGQARVWFRQIRSGERDGLCSTLLLTELLTGFRKKRDRPGEREALALIHGLRHLRVSDVTQSIADRAATLRARYGLRTPDAIHLATAIELKAKLFVTSDRKLRSIRGIKITVLGSTTLEESR